MLKKRTLVFTEDPDVEPITNMVALVPRDLMLSYDIERHQVGITCMCAYMCAHTNTQDHVRTQQKLSVSRGETPQEKP